MTNYTVTYIYFIETNSNMVGASGMGYGERTGMPKNSKDSPGPGSYELNSSVVLKREYPKFSFGRQKTVHE